VVSVVSVVKESNRPAVRRLAVLIASLWCLAAIAQPAETGDFLAPDLVELSRLDASIHLDIRYATSNNFTGHKLYAQARAFLQRPAAEALLRTHRALKAQGYGLLVFDGYRPWSVTKAFWDATPPDKHKFVADPQKGSRHNRGCAVDVGLYHLRTGKEVAMPSAFDEMSDRAAADYQGGTPDQRRTRALLRQALEKEGFKVNPDEWWHFDYQDWRLYRVLDLPFAEIHPSPRAPDAGRL
jgi:D-alanyl-D-alanine dipeptidase